VLKAVLAIGLWGAAVIGWLGHRLAVWERVLAMVAAAALIAALPASDLAGFVLCAAFAALMWRARGARPA
jgi:TRAP-type uncharacterized transport system fused permease subunit